MALGVLGNPLAKQKWCKTAGFAHEICCLAAQCFSNYVHNSWKIHVLVKSHIDLVFDFILLQILHKKIRVCFDFVGTNSKRWSPISHFLYKIRIKLSEHWSKNWDKVQSLYDKNTDSSKIGSSENISYHFVASKLALALSIILNVELSRSLY